MNAHWYLHVSACRLVNCKCRSPSLTWLNLAAITASCMCLFQSLQKRPHPLWPRLKFWNKCWSDLEYQPTPKILSGAKTLFLVFWWPRAYRIWLNWQISYRVRFILYVRCSALHCVTLHSIPFHCIPFHCIALHHITFHCIPLHCIALHHITLHGIAWHCITVHCIALHHSTWHYISLHCIASFTLHYITLHCIAMHCIALHHIALHVIPFHSITLHWIALHHIELHFIPFHSIPSRFLRLAYIDCIAVMLWRSFYNTCMVYLPTTHCITCQLMKINLLHSGTRLHIAV